MPVRAGHIELLGDLGQRPDAHILERRQLDALYLLGPAFVSPGGTAPLPLAACCCG
jgi:hypothetical protein